MRLRNWAVRAFLLSFAILAATPVAAQEPVRLGVLTIRSGSIASCGRQMEEGLQFALKERGGMLAGRKVEVFFGDSAGQPAQTRAKTLELVERNKVHVLTGPVAAFEAYAISDYVRQTETPMVISPAAADYYQSQGLSYAFHQLLRFLDEPASLSDPIGLLRKRLVEQHAITAVELTRMEERVQAKIGAALEFAQASPFPDPSELTTDVYA